MRVQYIPQLRAILFYAKEVGSSIFVGGRTIKCMSILGLIDLPSM